MAGHETAADDEAGAGADGDVDERVHSLLADLGEDVLARIDASATSPRGAKHFILTLQTIAFAAHLRTTGTRPSLVVCPPSVMHN
jgi:hypothetical protein